MESDKLQEIEENILTPFKRHSVSVTRFTIVGIFSGLLLLTMLTIIFYTYFNNSEAVLEISEMLLKKNTDLLIEKTSNYLEPAAIISKFWSDNYKKQNIKIDDVDQFQKLSVELLRSYKQFISLYYGDENGHLWGAERRNTNHVSKFNMSKINPGDRNSTIQHHIIDQSDKVVDSKKMSLDLIPRIRPWYKGAADAKATYWTDAYVFKTEKMQLGITASYPYYNVNGNLMGVVGCDIEIEQLSKFLSRLKIGKTGFGFIINGNNKIIAYPDFSKIISYKNNEPQVKTVDELKIEWLSVGLAKHLSTGKSMIYVDDETSGETKIISFTSFPKSFGREWKIVLVVPENDFVDQINETNLNSLIISVVILIISLFIISRISKNISRPIVILTKETNRITDFELDGDINISSPIMEIQLISTALSRLKRGLRAFKRYLPPLLVKQLIQSDEEVKLGGVSKELTILFTDISNFTDISEHMPPEKMMSHLSAYFDELTELIFDCQGTVDKYIGDSIMAFWGAPIANEKHAYYACKAAVLCQRKSKELNQIWLNQGLPEFHTRIGIHTGEAVVGNVGSSVRLSYSIIGDSVNYASRLEGVNKYYDTKILISQSTYQKVKDLFITRPVDFVVVKGRHEPLKIYELLDILDDAHDPKQYEMTKEYEKAFNYYLNLNWDQAIDILIELEKTYSSDPLIKMLLEKSIHFKDNPPTGDWWYKKLSEK